MPEISYEDYKSIINQCGGPKQFDPNDNNYFIVYEHNIELYNYYTVNDRCQAPERIYMTKEVAHKVMSVLNLHLLKSYSNKLTINGDVTNE
jgi:hypothetical protein